MSNFTAREVQKYVNVSTAHITQKDDSLLRWHSKSAAGLIVTQYDGGYFLIIAEDTVSTLKAGPASDEPLLASDESQFSPEFVSIIEQADAQGITLVQIDRDGGQHDLPTFDWY